MAKAQPVSIRPRDDSEDEEISDDEGLDQQEISEHEESSANDSEEDGSASDEDSQSSIEAEPAEETEALKDISFGALADAQARLNPNSRKRKLADRENDAEEKAQQPENDKWKYDPSSREKEQKVSRSSKHAPMITSSRNPVSRKREIFSPPASAKFRDPRFDAAVTADSRRGNTSSTHGASKAYAFLSDYQAKEILEMKAQMKKLKDPDQQAELKRKIMSTEAKLRNAETQRREAEIMQAHKRKERDEIREGKKAKPYYLKASEVKKQIIQERRDALGKKARDKSDKRKKMREKTKEARDMPRVRRVVG